MDGARTFHFHGRGELRFGLQAPGCIFDSDNNLMFIKYLGGGAKDFTVPIFSLIIF